jgi:hypothetical protein
MTNANPQLQLETLFLLDERQRIIATHEPHPSPGPALVIIRGESACAWAMRADVPDPAARDLERLASEEPPSADLNQPLRYADRYAELLGGGRIRCGPAFRISAAP